MIRRKCPNCGKNWHSSNTDPRDWECQSCGAVIPKSCEYTDKDLEPEEKERAKNE